MLNRFVHITGKRILKNHPPRWIIYVIDLSVWVLSILLAFYIRLNFNLKIVFSYPFHVIIPAVVLARTIVYLLFRLNAGLIRYSSLKDIERIIGVNLLGSVILVALNIVYNSYNIEDINLIPYGSLVIEFLLSTFLMISIRLWIKAIYHEIGNNKASLTNVVIYGVGELADITRQTIENNRKMAARVIGFINPADDKESCVGSKLAGIKIYSELDLESLARDEKIKKLIIAQGKTRIATKERLIEICSKLHIRVLMVSQPDDWDESKPGANRLRELNLEDLLERPVITLDTKKISEEFSGKVIMITGAAGSIGSELVWQLCRFNPAKLILFDQAETPLHSLILEFKKRKFPFFFETALGDITNRNRLENILDLHKPEIIFHAAAYKHVPMLEDNPKEAIRTNVFGTRILADLAIQHKVSKFIMISTDKAVNPTSIMGASKRISEIYIQSLNSVNNIGTNFITTRFGNVMGSNGSVIELFKEQISRNENVTVTHPEMERFFMTIPEAVQLVLEAGTMGNGGEIFVFDMGKMVKIKDLATKMVRLAGLIPGEDIRIEYIGTRPGERLYEELLAEKENLIPTHHPKILKAKVSEIDYKTINNELDGLNSKIKGLTKEEVVRIMMEIVPEFISQNPIYSELTKKTVPG